MKVSYATGRQPDPAIAKSLDRLATALFYEALKQNRCGEVLAHLFDGGCVTVDPEGDGLLLFHLPEETPA